MRRWVRRGALGVGGVLVVAGGVGWAVYAKLDANITPDEAAAAELARYEKERPTSLVRGAQNILLIGSDSRAGRANRRYGRDSGTERSDTTILLHLSAERRSATAVSIPRDLMVDVPSCRRRDGSLHIALAAVGSAQPPATRFRASAESRAGWCSPGQDFRQWRW